MDIKWLKNDKEYSSEELIEAMRKGYCSSSSDEIVYILICLYDKETKYDEKPHENVVYLIPTWRNKEYSVSLSVGPSAAIEDCESLIDALEAAQRVQWAIKFSTEIECDFVFERYQEFQWR